MVVVQLEEIVNHLVKILRIIYSIFFNNPAVDKPGHANPDEEPSLAATPLIPVCRWTLDTIGFHVCFVFVLLCFSFNKNDISRWLTRENKNR